MKTATLPGAFAADLSWIEVEEKLKTLRTVVLPVGAALKEHGLHLPLANDFLMAEYLAQRICRTSQVLLLPTLAYGHYPAFLEYPGSVSLRAQTFCDTVVDICASFMRHGVNNFYALNTGISTLKPLAQAQEILKTKNCRLEFTQFHQSGRELRKSLETQTQAGTHADEIETSMMLYICPEKVKLERARPELNPDRGGKDGLSRNPQTDGVYSPTGAWGDPTLATREKGEIIVEALVKEIAHFLHSEMGA